MTDLAAWLLEQVAEDDELASQAERGEGIAVSLLLASPALARLVRRMRAECDVKRRIIAAVGRRSAGHPEPHMTSGPSRLSVTARTSGCAVTSASDPGRDGGAAHDGPGAGEVATMSEHGCEAADTCTHDTACPFVDTCRTVDPTVTEYAVQMSGGGMHVRNGDPELERLYPLPDWIRHRVAEGNCYRRVVTIVEDWVRVEPADAP